MLHMLRAEDWPTLIQDGDLVVVYERFDSLKAVRVNARSEFSNKYGHFKMQVCATGVRQKQGCKPTAVFCKLSRQVGRCCRLSDPFKCVRTELGWPALWQSSFR